jgi:lipopolysaccharide transport system ATP-binding protein
MSAISIEDLWLSYRARRLRPPTLQATLGTIRQRTEKPGQWALRGIDLEVDRGQMLGIIGPNGSGKSTLLRCTAGIFRPSRGSVTVRGRVTSLIDLAAGFERDLSARENVMLVGAIYGVPRATLHARMSEVLEFAGLEDHADTALRTFSTGMAMRLGFSVVVSMEPDILLVDEVLAVGDEEFKVRCLERVGKMRDQGTTIVFVSHELALVRMFCDRVIVLEKGKLSFDGSADEALTEYCKHLGIDLDFALSHSEIMSYNTRRMERRWSKRR